MKRKRCHPELSKAFVCKCISEKEKLEYALYGQEKWILSGQDADWTHSFLVSSKLRCVERFSKGEGKSIVKYLPMGTKDSLKLKVIL